MTSRFRVLYVFVVLSLGRRRIVQIAVTEHPTAAWTAQRLIDAVAGSEQVPRFLIHHRDAVYGADFRRRVRGLGTRALLTPPRSPQANAFAERTIGTLRRDYLDHIIVWGERHAERILSNYVAYYHRRPHRGLRCSHPTAPDTCPRHDRCREPGSRPRRSSLASTTAMDSPTLALRRMPCAP